MLLAVALSAVFAIGACASDDDACLDGECVESPVDQNAAPDPAVCADQCAHFGSCGVLDADTCTHACTVQSFSAKEMRCLQDATCDDDGVGVCLDA
jgi:hypothetical protein